MRITMSYLILNKKSNLLIYLIDKNKASSQYSQPTINNIFNKQSGQKGENFIINYFKRLLLSFIINNNILF
jgi:hypothetical protein